MAIPLSWYGGKVKIAQWIMDEFVEHKTYIEPFAGGLAVLFRKPFSNTEIINDLNGDLINFYQQLRDNSVELKRLLTLTPYSEEEHDNCQISNPNDSPVEKARKFFVNIRQSIHNMEGNSWSIHTHRNFARDYASIVSQLDTFVDRLSRVHIHHRDYSELFKLHNDPDVLWYLDPPYMMETRKTKTGYQCDQMDHELFLDSCKTLTGAVYISGYPSELYLDKLKDWNCKSITVRASSTRSKDKVKSDRTEMLWFNDAGLRDDLM